MENYKLSKGALYSFFKADAIENTVSLSLTGRDLQSNCHY